MHAAWRAAVAAMVSSCCVGARDGSRGFLRRRRRVVFPRSTCQNVCVSVTVRDSWLARSLCLFRRGSSSPSVRLPRSRPSPPAVPPSFPHNHARRRALLADTRRDAKMNFGGMRPPKVRAPSRRDARPPPRAARSSAVRPRSLPIAADLRTDVARVASRRPRVARSASTRRVRARGARRGRADATRHRDRAADARMDSTRRRRDVPRGGQPPCRRGGARATPPRARRKDLFLRHPSDAADASDAASPPRRDLRADALPSRSLPRRLPRVRATTTSSTTSSA